MIVFLNGLPYSGIILPVAAFVIGVLISYINYRIALAFLRKKADGYALSSVLRQILSVAYLILLFIISRKTAAGEIYILLGGALGVTLPSFLFTAKLIKAQNEKADVKEDDDGREV